MLTVNADDLAVVKHFHKPGDEADSCDPARHQYNAWLDAPPARSMDLMQQYPAELLVAAPAPPKAAR
jgi:hypothetical protein